MEKKDYKVFSCEKKSIIEILYEIKRFNAEGYNLDSITTMPFDDEKDKDTGKNDNEKVVNIYFIKN